MSVSGIDKQSEENISVQEKPGPQLQANKTTAVQADEVKERLPELLQAVEEKGETVEITRNGAAVARLAPTFRKLTPEERKERKEFLQRFRQERKTWKPSGLTIEEIVRMCRDGR